jgi:hypothetical protein
MSHRHLVWRGTLAVVAGIGSFAAVPLAAPFQKPAAAVAGALAATTTIPRTPWGAPDLNGVWTGNTMTPLERSEANADKLLLTPAEVAAAEKRQAETALLDRPPSEGDPGTYNQIWTDPAFRTVPDGRTSLIVDPPNGRIPYTPQGRKLQEYVRAQRGNGPYDSPADLDTGERCLTDGVPVYFNGYNNNYQIFQTPDHVAILHEYFHEVRIIPLDGRPHVHVAQWLGDGRGRWEGDTLVVETVKFAEKGPYIWAAAWRASRATTRLVERFTRRADTIDYSFTWEDPTMFTQPWTARWPLSRQAAIGVTEGPLYEYACHEGNYAITNVLKGARAKEKSR